MKVPDGGQTIPTRAIGTRPLLEAEDGQDGDEESERTPLNDGQPSGQWAQRLKTHSL